MPSSSGARGRRDARTGGQIVEEVSKTIVVINALQIVRWARVELSQGDSGSGAAPI